MNGDIHILSFLLPHAATKNSVMFFEVLERVDAFLALLDGLWLQKLLVNENLCCLLQKKKYSSAGADAHFENICCD